jgi:hypothetical protein
VFRRLMKLSPESIVGMFSESYKDLEHVKEIDLLREINSIINAIN